MKINEILDDIKLVAEQEVNKGNTTENNKKLENGELLWAALALLGYGYSQVRGNTSTDDNPADFWPFGKFEPSQTARENLIRSCQMILFEIDRLQATE